MILSSLCRFDSTLFAHRFNPVRTVFLIGMLVLGFSADSKADINGDGKTVICFVGHKTSHGFGKHEYSAGNHLIEDWLKQEYPDAKIEGRHAIPWPENEEEFFKDADGVVFFCSGGGGHVVNNHVAEFDKVMRTGAGLSCLHYGVEVPIGPSAKGMLAWMGGYFEINWSVNPHWVAEFKQFTDHPVARGVKPFQIDDEWYFHMRFVEGMKGVNPILSAIAPAKTMERKDGAHSGNPHVRKAVAAGEPQHVAWTYERTEEYNKGRGFGFTGLHYHANWIDDSFRKTVLNGVAWTADLKIPEGGIDTETPSQEFLDENALKYGGDQGSKKKTAENTPRRAVNSDAKPLFHSKVITAKTPGHAVDIKIDLPGDTKQLNLVMADGGDGFSCDWGDWAEPRFVLADGTEKKLTDLDWIRATTNFGQVQKNKNVRGQDLKIAGKPVEYGIGAHANSVITFEVPKGAKQFLARGGLDNGGTDQQGGKTTSIQFLVYDQKFKVIGQGDEYVKKSSAPGREASEAVDSLEVHPGLAVQLFASEPMIGSPSSIDIDARGRVWVCDIVNYRRNQGKRDGGDKIMILEDTDGDAKADKSTVFYQGHDVDSAHGICVLGDRVIISAGEEVFSLYDRNDDGKADEGSKELMFTKIGGSQHDHGIHSFHFGPDGKLYFNFGNAGKQLCDPEGNLITDINGVKCTNQNNRPYQEGMVFRCDLDGKNVEILGWNFRNNWEVAVDSFGTVWQSDNDDDGNKAVRINYVMEYGNYGYKDEITGSGWREPRPGIEDEIPQQHWHQNDPGVVPNLLVTGAGSPTGIVVYEGDLLPEIFRGQVIHCDAGPNVVRSYITEPDGAGYKVTETVDLIKSTEDRWFRPSDVCVAPDGSLFVADWYDPGVGGHAMGDIEKGRIFRVIPKDKSKEYKTPELDFSKQTGENIVHLLKNPNEDVRFHAYEDWRAILQGANEELKQAFEGIEDPRVRARVLFAYGWIDSNRAFDALKDSDPNIRIAALRLIRNPSLGVSPEDAFEAAATLAKDPDPQVRREVLLAIRHNFSPEANNLWVELAKLYDGTDRWYLEALGIAADLSWIDRLGALGKNDVIHPSIVWRSRAPETALRLANLIIESEEPDLRHLRALDFQTDAAKAEAYELVFQRGNPEMAIAAAGKLGRDEIDKIEGGQVRLEALLAPIRGKAEFIFLAEKLNLRGFEDEVADFIAANPGVPESVTAAKILMRDRGKLGNLLRDASDPAKVGAIASAVGKTNDRAIGGLLGGELTRKEMPASVKRILIDAMAMSSNAGRELLKIAQQKDTLDDSLKATAALAFARSPDQNLRNEAAKILPVPKATGADSFSSLEELVEKKGDSAKGPEFFTRATCNTCHKVKGEGIDFGPDLSEIGNKLSREAMFQAILYPNAAISHGFHGVTVEKKDGTSLIGYITGETDQELQLRLLGGVQQSVSKQEIKSQTEMAQSLMPPGLAAIIGEQGLVDLVGWLQSLK